VLRHDGALVEVDLGEHHVLAGDEAPSERRVEVPHAACLPRNTAFLISHDAESMERWATFDCYGTLIDWNGGIGRQLERLFGAEHVARLLHDYHELERAIEHEAPGGELSRGADDRVCAASPRVKSSLSRTTSRTPSPGHSRTGRPSPRSPRRSQDARARGWRLAILSNTDRDYIDAFARPIGVPFDVSIVASEIGSYKPGHRHWEVFREAREPATHVHVGASLFHDIVPATELGLRTVWITVSWEDASRCRTSSSHTLAGLGASLDSLAAE
jgi:2-haloacid dehalogenase